MLTSLIAMAASQAMQPPRVPPPMPTQYPPTPPAVPPPPPSSTPPRLIAGSISNADYPSAAIRDEAEGSVRVVLDIGPDGLATGCEVTESSGHPVLDATTCNIASRRFRFRPATRGGSPVAGRYVQRVTWLMPEGPLMPFVQGRFDWTVTVSPASSTQCLIATTGDAFADYDYDQCADPQGDRMIVREEMGAGHPPVRLRNVLSLLPASELSALPRLQGVPFFEWTGEVEIDYVGRVTSCSTIATLGTPPGYANFPFRLGCRSVMGKHLFREAVGTPVRRARLGSSLFVEVLVPPR